MKKLFLFLFVITFVTTEAQSDSQDGWVSRMGGGGGFVGFYVKPDLTPISPFLKGFGTGDLAQNGLFGFGGGGFAYVMVMKNLRVGGVGFKGSSSQSATVNGYNKTAVYSYGAGGATVEYTLPFPRKVSISVGAIIGGGSAELDIYQNKGVIDWNSLSSDLVGTSSSKISAHKLINNFFTFAPTINLDVPLSRFAIFRIGGGYFIPFSNNWKADNDITLLNMPSDFNSRAFFVQAGLYFGFFIF
jgi:hypothetical protein